MLGALVVEQADNKKVQIVNKKKESIFILILHNVKGVVIRLDDS